MSKNINTILITGTCGIGKSIWNYYHPKVLV